MCVVAISKRGQRQPTEGELYQMFVRNPHGAGYMVARDNCVTIHKGFMTWANFSRAVRHERFTASDAVVYHFRISTQAGIKPEMTHPFPLTSELKYHECLDVECSVGVAHNGIIPLTSDYTENRYSDTSLFVAKYLTRIIQRRQDLTDTNKLQLIERLAQSKLAILDKFGDVATVGKFTDCNGILVSNTNHLYNNYNIKWNF